MLDCLQYCKGYRLGRSWAWLLGITCPAEANKGFVCAVQLRHAAFYPPVAPFSFKKIHIVGGGHCSRIVVGFRVEDRITDILAFLL